MNEVIREIGALLYKYVHSNPIITNHLAKNSLLVGFVLFVIEVMKWNFSALNTHYV